MRNKHFQFLLSLQQYQISMRKKLTTYCILLSTLLAFSANAQPKDDGFKNLPKISKQIVIEKDGIEIKKALFKFHQDYNYGNGLIFGSDVMLFLDGIQDVNNFEGSSFIMKKERITSADGKRVIVDTDWKVAAQGFGIKLKEKEHLYYEMPVRIGNPMYSGDYIWTAWIADICGEGRTKITVPFTVIPHPMIEVILEGAAKVSEVYMYNEAENKIYTTDKVKQGALTFIFKNIDGFEMVNGKYKVGMEMTMYDSQQKEIAEIDDAMTGEAAFHDPVEGKLQMWADYTFGTSLIGKKVIIKARIWDKNGSGSVIKANTLVYIN